MFEDKSYKNKMLKTIEVFSKELAHLERAELIQIC